MNRPVQTLLQDMLVYISSIEQATQGGEAVFHSDLLIQDAVVRRYEVTGEVVKRMPPRVLTAYSDKTGGVSRGFAIFWSTTMAGWTSISFGTPSFSCRPCGQPWKRC
jgi:hypothetical protein